MHQSAVRGRDLARAVVALLALTLALGAGVAAAAQSPQVVRAPTITGALHVGSVLTASGGAWSPPGSIGWFDWLRCDSDGQHCKAIRGALNRKYTLTDHDVGHTLVVRLRAVTASEVSSPLTSAPTDVVPPHFVLYPIPPPPETGRVRPLAIDPFPIVRIAGTFNTRGAKFARVTVVSPKATVRASCHGKGCPFKSWTSHGKVSRVRKLERRFPAGVTVELRVTAAHKIGKDVRMKVLGGHAPVRRDRCLAPGKSKPVRCTSL